MSKSNIGIFYPQSICLYENLLKNYLLFFDKILFLPNDTRLNPGYGTNFRNRFSINDSILDYAFYSDLELKHSIEYSSEEKCWSDKLKKIMDEYDKLEENGILEIIHNEDFSDIYQRHPLESSITADLSDPRFITTSNANVNARKIDRTKDNGGPIKGGGIMIRPRRKGLLFPEICSEKINTTLYFAELYGATPITNHRKFNLLLRNKANRCWQNQDYLDNEGLAARIKKAMILVEISRQVIPGEVVQNKSISDILKYKNKSLNKEIEYQKCINDLEKLSIENLDSKKIESEIAALVSREIVPKINEINKQKKDLWGNLFKESIDAFCSPEIMFPIASMPIIPKIPILSAHLFPNLSYMDILIYSTTFFGMKIAPQIINSLIDRNNIRKNSLSFLIDFK